MKYFTQAYPRLCELENRLANKEGAEELYELVQASLNEVHAFYDKVNTWLASLPKEQSRLIKLKYFQNKKWKEVAEIYGCSVKEVQRLSKLAISSFDCV